MSMITRQYRDPVISKDDLIGALDAATWCGLWRCFKEYERQGIVSVWQHSLIGHMMKKASCFPLDDCLVRLWRE
jgi:hypothetical protein